jgi:hypothetical protein
MNENKLRVLWETKHKRKKAEEEKITVSTLQSCLHIVEFTDSVCILEICIKTKRKKRVLGKYIHIYPG